MRLASESARGCCHSFTCIGGGPASSSRPFIVVGAAASSWLFLGCLVLSRLELGLPFRFPEAASEPASPFGVAADFRPGVGAGVAVSDSLAAVSLGQVGAAARRGRRRSPLPSAPSCPSSFSPPREPRLAINALDLGLDPPGFLPLFLPFSLLLI